MPYRKKLGKNDQFLIMAIIPMFLNDMASLLHIIYYET